MADMDIAESDEATPASFREIAKSFLEKDDDYEAPLLLLIPVYLRDRRRYYLDSIATIRKLLDELWVTSQFEYPSREDFEKSRVGETVWNATGLKPYWWGVNDVVGFIDIRVCVRSRQLQAALFLPHKQISRRLKHKEPFVFQRKESIALGDRATNEELRAYVKD